MIKVTVREVVRHALHRSTLDRVLMRRRAARGQDIGHLALDDRRSVFGYVYEKGVWLNGREEGALSGAGSELVATQQLGERLGTLLHELKAESLLDVGCGYFTWMQHVNVGSMAYTGVDIVPSVVADNEERFGKGGRHFLCLDVVSEPLPVVDVVLCREVLFHLSFSDGRRVIENIRRSGARHLIVTSDRSTAFNSDIRTGDFRMLNLQRRPYGFPVPKHWIPDDSVTAGRGLAVWAVADLR